MDDPQAFTPTTDVEIKIKRDGAAITLRSSHEAIPQSGAPPARHAEIPALDDAWERLQEGQVRAEELAGPAGTIGRWFMEEAVGRSLELILKGAPNNSVRLALKVHDDRLADVPFELVQSPMGPGPLGLDRRIASVVYVPPEAPPAVPGRKPLGAPVRVLMVRSNPESLQANVPPAVPIRSSLLESAGPELRDASTLLTVQILSREGRAGDSGVVGLPTLADMQRFLETGRYDILVYLGHGDVKASQGVLELEDDQGRNSDSVNVAQLAAAFGGKPLPVVLLVGCVTAAGEGRDAGDDRDAQDERDAEDELNAEEDRQAIANWLRGSRNVARALVERDIGVEVAIGMRSLLEASAAETLLTAFFRSFLRDRTGHVEAALHAARRALEAKDPDHVTWLAPLAYRAYGTEPMFELLAKVVATKRPDPGLVRLEVNVLDKRQVKAVVEGLEDPSLKTEATDQLGDELLAEAVSLMEYLVRREALRPSSRFEVLGGLLYRLLFNGEIGKLFQETCDHLTARQRLLVQLGFSKEEMDLASLPWEYLRAVDAQPPFFFSSFGGKVTLVLSRFDSGTQSRPFDPEEMPESGRLRVLLVIGRSPSSAADVEDLRTALARLADQPIKVTELVNPQTKELTERIKEDKPHVVHYVGQGRPQRGTGEQAIQLSTPVAASDFVSFLVTPVWRPRIVFLQLTGQGGQNDFSRLGPGLIERDVQAVVAMRYPITSEAARSFCEKFYPKLAQGEMVDLAVQAGLVNMLQTNAEAVKRSDRLFGTPVFYIQRPDRILQPPVSMPQPKPEAKGDGADLAGRADIPPDRTQVSGTGRDPAVVPPARPPRLAPPPGELPSQITRTSDGLPATPDG